LRKSAAEKVEEESKARIVGKEVVMLPHASLSKNTWNPNTMTPFERESLKHGLRTDGWLLSQSLLVWGTDEKGRKKNIIIDGEHRWTVSGELGMRECPAVVLHKITEAYAKQLTIKMFQRRGHPDEDRLTELLRSLDQDLALDTRALDLGIQEDKLADLLRVNEPEIGGAADVPGVMPSGQASHVRVVQLLFNPDQHEAFMRTIKELAAVYKTANVTDTVAEAVKRARADSGQK